MIIFNIYLSANVGKLTHMTAMALKLEEAACKIKTPATQIQLDDFLFFLATVKNKTSAIIMAQHGKSTELH